MNFRLVLVHRNNTEKMYFNQKGYEEFLITKFLPICKQSMLLDERITASRDEKSLRMVCKEFIPSLTNHGICLTRNAAKIDNIFKTSNFMSTFADTFYQRHYNHEVKNVQKELSAHHFSFVIDGNSFKDMRRGKDWMNFSPTAFKLGIHSPKDIADIRGWYNQIMTIPTGYTTKIIIRQSELIADETLKSITMEKRGCRFTHENTDLSSVRAYSKVNCLLDCKIQEAEKICGCRPWDYPESNLINTSWINNAVRICDFYGNSCFNKILQENDESTCHKRCIPNCNEISYDISIDREPIDNGGRICDLDARPINALEFEVKKNLMSQLLDDTPYGASIQPEKRILSLVKDILLKGNFSHNRDVKEAYKNDCINKVKSDIAAVIVSIKSPVFTRMVKSLKVSFFDQLAIVGK